MSKQSKEEKRMNIIAQNGNDGLHYSLGVREDSIVESVKEEWSNRSKDGQFKYGTTLEDNNHDDFLQHAIEESMDFILYLRKIQFILKEKGYNNLNEINSTNKG